MEEQYLKVGDSISLFSEEVNGFVTTAGFAETRVCLTKCSSADNNAIPEFQDAVFEIHVFKNYASHTAYIKTLETTGLDAARPSRLNDNRELASLKRAMEAEYRTNEASQERATGQYVTYGQTIELRHIKSNKFLKISDIEAAEKDRDALACSVGSENEYTWFKIMPKYRLQSEGDRVHVGDKVVLVNVKTQHTLYLNTSETVDMLNLRFEINGSNSASGFKVHSYCSVLPKDIRDEVINGGEFIRFFSKEYDGYMMVQDSVDPSNSMDSVAHIYSSSEAVTSSNSLFCIEHIVNSRGDPFKWEDCKVRLKHLGTGLYVSASDKPIQLGDNIQSDQSDDIQYFALTLTRSSRGKSTVFQLESLYPDESEGNITVSSSFRLKAVDSGCYLHILAEYWDEKPQLTRSQDPEEQVVSSDEQYELRAKLCMCSKAHDEDLLVVVRVVDDEMTNINTVKAVIEPLLQYIRAMDEGRFPSPNLRIRVTRILRDLIFFVQNVPDDKARQDPLLLDEPTLSARQTVLKEQGIMDLLLQLLRVPFDDKTEKGEPKQPLIDVAEMKNNPDLKPYHYICQLCYRLLKQVIKDNRECERYLSKPEVVKFMQSQLGYNLKTADTLMELFKDNHYLLDHLSNDHINIFFEMIRDHGKLSRYISFLNVLVTCNGEAHPKNQLTICKLLLDKHVNECMIGVKLENGVVVVDLDSVKAYHENAEPDWVSIHTFLSQAELEQLNYFERLISTMANLCLGRNKECAELVAARFPFELCFAIATDNKIKGSDFPLRTAMFRLIRAVYLDCDPHVDVSAPNFSRVWGKFDSPNIPQHSYADDLSKGDIPASAMNSLASLTKVTGDQIINFEPLKNFLKSWIADCKSQNSQEEAKNCMTLAVLEVLRDLVLFGFFHSTEELADLMLPLMACLDGRDDRVGNEDVDISSDLRYLRTSSNLPIMQCKYQILNIFEIIAKLRVQLRLTMLLKVFYDRFMQGQYKVEDADESKSFFAHTFSRSPDSFFSGIRQAMRGAHPVDSEIEHVFEKLRLEATARHPVEILEDCTKYESDPLVQEAFRTVIRNFNQRTVMLQALTATQLLISEESERIFNLVKRHCDTISRELYPDMSSESEAKVLECLQSLETVAEKSDGTPSAINQQILCSVNAHEVVHRLLQLPFTNSPNETGRRNIFLACYRFLLKFTRRNTHNQRVLLEHVDFYLSQLGMKLKAAETITEIFRDNKHVCSQIDERTIRRITEILANKGQYPRYLRFLQTIVCPEGRSLKRNQDLVLKTLLKRTDKILVLFLDREGREERSRLLSQREHETDPEGKLNYHAALMSLLADIVANHNQLGEAKCAALVPFEECCNTLSDSTCPAFIKASWMEFFRECYFEVERIDRSFEDEKKAAAIWTVLKHLADEVGEVVDQRTEFNHDYVRNFGRLVDTLYSKVFLSIGTHDRRANDVTVAVISTLAALLETNLPRRPYKAVVKAVTAVKDSKIAHKDVVSLIPSNFGLRRDVVKSKVEMAGDEVLEAKIKKGLALFVEDYKEKTGLAEGHNSKEYEELVKLFLDEDPAKTAEIPPSLSDPGVFPWGQKNKNTIKVISLLAGMKGETDLKRMCLRVLRDLASYEHLPTVTVAMSQNRLDKLGEYTSRKFKDKTFGATTMMMRMICDPKHEDVLKQTLELGIALLQDGNVHVQERIYKHFVNDVQGTFFEGIRDLIRRGCDEVKERKAYSLRKKEVEQCTDLNDPDSEKCNMPEFHERAFTVELLRFIQLTCEGHNKKLQEYWRHQHSGVRSYDIISEIANYLVELHASGVDKDNIGAVIQCLETLTELMQGPSKANQFVLSLSKLPSTCNKILLQRDFPNCTPDMCMELQTITATTLSALLEGCRDNKVPINIANDFDFDNLLNLLVEIEKDPCNLEEGSVRVRCADEIFCFVLIIREYVPEVKVLVEQYETKGHLSYFFAHTGNIEISHDGDMERIFFAIPKICIRLTERSKQTVLWTVDRASPGKKVEHFLEFADQLEEEMKHNDRLQSNKFFNFMTRIDFDGLGTKAAFWLAVFINSIMFFNYTLTGSRDIQHALEARASGCDASIPPESGGCPTLNLAEHSPHLEPSWEAIVVTIGVVLTSIESLVFVFFVLQFAPLIVRKGMASGEKEKLAEKMKLSAGKQRKDEMEERPSLIARAFNLLLPAYFLMQDTKFVTTLALVVSGFLGLSISPLFFSFHLFNIVEMSIDLKNVLRAVTENGKSLAITAVFGVMIVYLFAIWGFISFRDHYETDDGDLLCQNLMQCTITSLSAGLRKGDIGEIMTGTEWGNPGMIFFELMYFAVVITILLNIIFGIIIDTFGELRSNKAAVEEDMVNNCFICSIDRYTFDRYTEGFVHHIKNEHNMWQYVFFLVYLHEKDPNKYTGAESYVDELVKRNDASWFPINQAIKLMEHLAEMEEAQTRVLARVEEAIAKTNELDKKVDRILSQQTEMLNAHRSQKRATKDTAKQQKDHRSEDRRGEK